MKDKSVDVRAKLSTSSSSLSYTINDLRRYARDAEGGAEDDFINGTIKLELSFHNQGIVEVVEELEELNAVCNRLSVKNDIVVYTMNEKQLEEDRNQFRRLKQKYNW